MQVTTLIGCLLFFLLDDKKPILPCTIFDGLQETYTRKICKNDAVLLSVFASGMGSMRA